jgi:hypothetical protein
LNELQVIGALLSVMGILLIFFIAGLAGVIVLFVGLVTVYAGGRRHSVVQPVQPLPQPQNPTVIVQREVVRTKCRYCGTLNDPSLLKCQSCGASLG